MTRTIDTRVNVLRNGVKITSLVYDEAPSITIDNNAVIKSSMQGTFMPNDVVDWLSDQLQPVLIIDGVEHPIGVYDTASINTARNDSIDGITIEAYDRCWRVQSYKTPNTIHLNAGTNYVQQVQNMLVECGIGAALVTPTSETLREDREDWEIGTDYLTIINQLLSEINYNDLWFDANGMAMIQPKAELTASGIVRTYDSKNVNSLMLRNSNVSIDLFNTPNVFHVVCSNPDDASVMVATSVNESPTSPFSVLRRGRRIVELVRVDNIASQEALDDYASLMAMKSAMAAEVITINTGLMPGVGINEPVAIVHEDAEGLCYETGWRMELSAGGNMVHTLEKAVVM